MDESCQRNGIVHQKTVPYSPQQNGVAERVNRMIMEKARSMMHYKGVSTSWWTEAISTAVYLTNRKTNSTHTDATSYAIGFKMKPRLDPLRIYGSIGYAHVDDAKRTKLEPKSFTCMFLGYGDNTKGYRVYDLELDKGQDVNISEARRTREPSLLLGNGLIMADENTMDSGDDPYMTIISIRRHPNDLVLMKTNCLQKLY
ncbi:hypothetical protein DD238_005998 [Peronospora effusa]|uniref:Integrase catalytic domain-containing protein n=1 Tax=Peronospora effusa TaxID=542832 RepID=A0A3M6VNH2_9STRA|nr:hypothetical protein DD238_005998 [Peronospora effusa]